MDAKFLTFLTTRQLYEVKSEANSKRGKLQERQTPREANSKKSIFV
jgi:hypothetical protein